ncbi:DUF2293 domain-containing protein [Sinorhizobium meliloti]|uniref:DUF2293 domain-containing protein n=1 Tax=Rhizobium meliloti (strain 1021) TaxID=266834 RepID=Q92JT5_RHIME|nr:Hypothetical protein SM2011_c03294 [Sinorhizobium meliloti 2011]ASP58469.1 DUF2293 domain-containing protein [Sinorhizobium meliloti]RVI95709.1 DUF2293 domain-containing protein [Sinorhizobium medicae]CAC47718.1 Hypothetical protein SMc03294 [Sinorhizobium meliloti 1021]MCK3802124.1 DUF2293 domain-containing protein [Sinorhizobium meliloti]
MNTGRIGRPDGAPIIATTKFAVDDVRCHIRHHHPGCPEFAVDFFSAAVTDRAWQRCTLGTAVGIVMQVFLRHHMTEYDQLLLIGIEREEARRRVQPRINAMLATWRKPPVARDV